MIHIDSLKLENFRGLQNISLDFPGKTTVIVGVNGVGKTAILEALAVMMSALVSRILGAPQRSRNFLATDIQLGKSYLALDIAMREGNYSFSWNQVRNRSARLKSENRSDFTQLNNASAYFATALLESAINGRPLQTNLPLAVFYSVNRSVRDVPMRVRRKESYTPVDAFESALDSSGNFRSFFYWFRIQEDLENERKRDERNYIDPQLDTVRTAIANFLPEYADLRIRRSPLRMTIKKSEEELDIRLLSDGEKCLLSMVGDLARRLALANPLRENKLEGDGIVLIDEIDLHLHPKWQREIIPALERTFPNCQFIVSTHSPQVLSHIKAENVWLLTASGKSIRASRPRVTFGMDSSRILEEVMEVPDREPSVKEDLRKLFLMLESGNFGISKQLLTALKIQLGDIPELIRADALLKRKEMLGR